MNLHSLRILALGLAVLISGCATRTKMAFEADDEKLTETSKPVYLMTATLKNTYHPSFQPKLIVVHVEKPGAKDAAGRLNFTMDTKAKAESNTVQQGNSYFLRMQLEPGPYQIVGMSSMASSFPITGFFFAPIHTPLEAGGSGVYYLGHVAATVRERVGDEFKAGPSIPLIDQAVAGASGGTFDVEISDQWETEEAQFLFRFPALKGVVVKKAILPAFDRAVAQKWWEAH